MSDTAQPATDGNDDWQMRDDRIMMASNLKNQTDYKTPQNLVDRFIEAPETRIDEKYDEWYGPQANSVLVATDTLKDLYWLARSQDTDRVLLTVPRGFYPFRLDLQPQSDVAVDLIVSPIEDNEPDHTTGQTGDAERVRHEVLGEDCTGNQITATIYSDGDITIEDGSGGVVLEPDHITQLAALNNEEVNR
jgi:hypothetical protein